MQLLTDAQKRLARDLAFYHSISQAGFTLCGPTCHIRYGWCFDHGRTTGTGPEVLR